MSLATLVSWWGRLPGWARWTAGLVALLAVGVPFVAWGVLRRGRLAVAGAGAQHAANDAAASSAAAARVGDAVDAFAVELAERAARAAEEDAQSDGEAAGVVGEVVGDGLSDLGSGVLGGGLEDL